VTPGAAWALDRDDALLDEVPRDLRVIRTRSFEPRLPLSGGVSTRDSEGRNHHQPHPLKSQLGHLKRFPDAHLGWLPFAIGASRRQAYDVAYSSSGPFTSHLVGLVLKRLTRKPWVLELRDGWYRWNRAIFPDYPRWRDALERRLEAAALRSADHVVLVTDRMADAFRQQYPDLPTDRFSVVSNGFDPCQFDASRDETRRDGWEVLHAGALYYGRSIAALLEAIRRLLATDADFARDFRLVLLGSLDANARVELARSGLGDRIRFRGRLDHASAIRAMRSADALLLVANTTPGAEATVPGKLFEYLAVGRPVIAVAPSESSTADVLERTSGGWLAPAGDADAIGCVLRRAHTERTQPANAAEVARFDRRVLAGELARTFDQVVAGAARRA
jgi:glycosyltransferase involved in cell wall biosynthesis